MVVVSGGDGSVNEVARALHNTDVPMAIIPTGSGNGLARHLKIPVNVEKAIQLLNIGKPKLIDVGTMNDRIFVNMAGTGFDAFIADAFSRYGKRGFWSYVKVTLKNLRKYKPQTVHLTLNGQKLERKIFSVSIANSKQFGNDAIIAHQAEVDDGILDISVIHHFPWYMFPLLVPRMFIGNLHTSKYYEGFKAESFVLETALGVASHLDGDPYFFSERLQFGLKPLKLKIIVP
jgi:YegS/Rv2252/BmrU family lipid kinase